MYDKGDNKHVKNSTSFYALLASAYKKKPQIQGSLHKASSYPSPRPEPLDKL